MANRIMRFAHPDMLLLNITIILALLGVITSFDCGYYSSIVHQHNPYYFLERQGIWTVIGIISMLILSNVDYRFWRKISSGLMIFATVLLFAVWAPKFGIVLNDAHRWVGFGFLRFQPSEFMKICLILFLSAWLSSRLNQIRNDWVSLIFPMIVIGVVCGIVEKEPDLGTAGIIAMTAIVILILAGIRISHVFGIFTVFLACLALLTFTSGHRMHRLDSWFNPKANYLTHGFQVYHAEVAIGSGMITGMGIGHGEEKSFLPEANTDYVFATFGEEIGLIGCLTIICLLGIVVWRAFRIARNVSDPFASLVAGGIGGMISIQSIINIAMVTRIGPSVGIPLPFLSYGGTSALTLLSSIGILLNISLYAKAPASIAVVRNSDSVKLSKSA
jgi:cell division protein FtsW